jgi:hypothetical protein
MKRVTKSGGWVQLIEINPMRYCDDGTMPSESPLTDYERVVEAVMRNKYGITIREVGPNIARYLASAGFANITENNIKSPLGKWSGGNTFLRSCL